VSIEIREGEFEPFFQAPFACYGRDAFVSSPLKGDLKRALDDRANPLFRDFARRTWFTAHRDGRVVGRVLALIHDASNVLHTSRRGSFGLFDCVDDIDVARALLDAAANWLRTRGCDEIAGPFNLTITQMIGVVTDGFEHRPYTYQDMSPPHVARLLGDLGFERFYPMTTFEVDVATVDLGSLAKKDHEASPHDPAWRIEPLSRWRLRQQLVDACTVLNDGFADNPMFVPLTPAEFLFASRGMRLVMDPRIACIAYENERPIGVLLCLPDLNPFLHATRYRLRWNTPWLLWRHRRRNDRAAVVFYSVRRDRHGLGVNGAMLRRCLTAMRDRGYRSLGISWISDGNAASLRQMEKLGARPLHRLHLFRKAL
jgi:GNAT superfamily N-acetyltransferase